MQRVHARATLLYGTASAGEFTDRDPKLHDLRYVSSLALRSNSDSPALRKRDATDPLPAGKLHDESVYIGAFGEKGNCLTQWILFGPEFDYDTTNPEGAEGQT